MATVARVFISYRISESAGHAGRLADALKSIYGRAEVFLGADDIGVGTLWKKKLREELRASRVVLTVIGPTWATVTGSDGKARIMAEDDVVRFEIREALGLNTAVIAVLVGTATVPPPSSLPNDIRALLERNIITLRDEHWMSDTHQLAQAAAALHPTLRFHFWSSRLVSWRVTMATITLALVIIASLHVLLVRIDLLDARTLELLPLFLGLTLSVVLLFRFVVRRAR